MGRLKYEPEKHTIKEKLIFALRREPVAVTHPTLVTEWLPDALGPECFSHGSGRLTWWHCQNGHYFKRSVCGRTAALDRNSKARGCSYCSGRLSLRSNGLTRLFPELAKEWDSQANGPADVVSPLALRTVAWKCLKGHVYSCMISARTNEFQDCPQCDAGERINLGSALERALIVFVETAGEYFGPMPELNLGYDPTSLPVSHKVWWKCRANAQHCFYRSVRQLSETNFTCPQCQRINAGNLVDYPRLVAQLHPTLNGRINSQNLFAGSSKNIWWFCKEHPQSAWQTPVYKRTLRGEGCPLCSEKKTCLNNVTTFSKSMDDSGIQNDHAHNTCVNNEERS